MTEATQQMVNDKESVLDLPRSSTETPVSFSVKFATEHEVIQSPTPPPESIVTETVTVPNPVVLTPVPQSPLPHISKSVEQLAAGSRLEWLFKRTTPLTRANSDSRRSRTSRSNNGTSEASIGASSARVLPSLAFSFSARSKSNSSQQRDPALALSGSTRSFTNNTLSMNNSGRQSTTVSISASDYHLRYNKSPPKRRVRTYFRGPIDKRAVSGRDLEALFSDLELALLDQGMEVVDSGVKTGEYKFTVTQPGMVVCGTPLPGVKLRGVPVDLKMLAKKGGEFSVLEKTIMEDKVSVVRLESGMSKALEREVKSREHVSGPGGGGFPIWVSKKVQYLQSYGINYNKGYDGKAAGGISGFKKVMAAVPPLPSVEDGASAASSLDKPATVVRFVDEIIFYVEVFRLKELKDMYVVEFKRKSGDIWEFKELYQRLIAELPLTKEY
ncbi:hypothetical protein HDU99_005026 [Rhizoclosmatium hyalinum]|nr:hypothetical protein HDU99_005026 [Rhizoclosmatium hyalinum]